MEPQGYKKTGNWTIDPSDLEPTKPATSEEAAKMHERILLDFERRLGVSARVIHRRLTYLEIAGQCFDRSLAALAEHHRLGDWRFSPPGAPS